MSAVDQAAFLTVPGPCDLACVFCVSYRREAPQGDPGEELLALLAEIDRQVEAGVRRIAWGNGDHEPATFPHLAQVIRHARDRGVAHQALVTNGFELGAPGALEPLVAAGLNEVRVALFGWDATSADLFVDGEGVAERKRALLRACQELGVAVEATVLLMRCNYQKVGEIIDLYGDLLRRDQPLSLRAVSSTQRAISPVFLPPYTGLYQRVVEAARARPDRKFCLLDHPDCLRRGLPPPSPNLTLVWLPEAGERERCSDCPGGEACGGFPPGYDEIHRDRLEPDLAPLHAPLSLEKVVEVLRDPPDDPFTAVARILDLPAPAPYEETDPLQLAKDPSGPFFGMTPEEVAAHQAEEARQTARYHRIMAEDLAREALAREALAKKAEEPRRTLSWRLRHFLFPGPRGDG